MNIYVLRLQKLVNLAGYSPALKEDGEYGPKTEQGIVWLDNRVRIFSKMPGTPSEPTTGKFDERTEKNIATLLPVVQDLARKFMTELGKSGINARIIGGTRTYAEQDEIYAEGRTLPGKKRTDAPGGYSNHNFGLAIDLGIFDGSFYLEESPLYEIAGPIGKAVGFSWGGDWSKPDMPHYEYRPYWASNMSERTMVDELRRRKKAGIDLLA